MLSVSISWCIQKHGIKNQRHLAKLNYYFKTIAITSLHNSNIKTCTMQKQ